MAKRPTEDHKIELSCITIDVDGLTTTASNPKCKDWNGGEDGNGKYDGFIYTCSTKLNDDKSYSYNYSENKEYIDIDKIGGNIDKDRYANCIRNLTDMKGNNISESTINAKELWASKAASQFSGNVTQKDNFIYNEGNNISNDQADTAGDSGEGHYLKSYYKTDDNGEYELDEKGQKIIEARRNFYDENTKVFSDQLTAVREL